MIEGTFGFLFHVTHDFVHFFGRGRNQRGRATSDTTGWVSKAHSQPSEATTREEAQINGASGSRKAEPESGTSVLSLQDRIRELEKHVVKKVVVLSLFSVQEINYLIIDL